MLPRLDSRLNRSRVCLSLGRGGEKRREVGRGGEGRREERWGGEGRGEEKERRGEELLCLNQL